MNRKPYSFYFLIFFTALSIIFLPACNKKKIENMTQQIQTLQTKNTDLQKDLAAKTKAATDLEKEKSGLQAKLPVASEARPGDSHWKIGYDFLVKQKNVPDDVAKKILWGTPLSSTILVGNKVLNFYEDGVFGTLVAQGTAPVSPAYLARQEQKKIAEEKAKLEGIIASQKENMEALKAESSGKEKENLSLKAEAGKIPGLNKSIAGLTKENEGLQVRLNSVYYLVGSKSALKSQGKIKGSFLGICGTRINEVSAADFTKSLDLRNTAFIEIQAADLGLTRIAEVDLLPWRFDLGRDYSVEISDGGRTARVRLLKKERFMLTQIVLIVK